MNGRSHESASLQLCDLIAGFVTRAYAPSPSEEFTSFLRAAEEAGMSELRVFPIDAGTDIPDGPPQRANGPDVVDRIATALRPSTRIEGSRRPLLTKARRLAVARWLWQRRGQHTRDCVSRST